MTSKLITYPIAVMSIASILSIVMSDDVDNWEFINMSVLITGLVTGGVVLGAIAGAHFLAIGLDSASIWIAFEGGLLLSIWVMMSTTSFTFFIGGNMIGTLFYSIITVMYMLGVVLQTKLGTGD